MIRPDQIPDEVVEAAAKAEYELIRDEYRDDYGVSILTDAHPPWERMHDSAKDYYRKHCRAAIAAALSAWPGALISPDEVIDGELLPPIISLPFKHKGDA